LVTKATVRLFWKAIQRIVETKPTIKKRQETARGKAAVAFENQTTFPQTAFYRCGSQPELPNPWRSKVRKSTRDREPAGFLSGCSPRVSDGTLTQKHRGGVIVRSIELAQSCLLMLLNLCKLKEPSDHFEQQLSVRVGFRTNLPTVKIGPFCETSRLLLNRAVCEARVSPGACSHGEIH